MNTSVLHAMAMESAENVLCGTNVAQQNRQGGTEKFFRKNNWRMDTVLPVNLYPAGAYEVELPESEETIEVLSEWEKQQKMDAEGLTEAYTQTPAEAKTSGGIQDKETAEGTAEKTENAIYGICIDIGTTTLAALA